jgi:hypothetical protein
VRKTARGIEPQPTRLRVSEERQHGGHSRFSQRPKGLGRALPQESGVGIVGLQRRHQLVDHVRRGHFALLLNRRQRDAPDR